MLGVVGCGFFGSGSRGIAGHGDGIFRSGGCRHRRRRFGIACRCGRGGPSPGIRADQPDVPAILLCHLEPAVAQSGQHLSICLDGLGHDFLCTPPIGHFEAVVGQKASQPVAVPTVDHQHGISGQLMFEVGHQTAHADQFAPAAFLNFGNDGYLAVIVDEAVASSHFVSDLDAQVRNYFYCNAPYWMLNRKEKILPVSIKSHNNKKNLIKLY